MWQDRVELITPYLPEFVRELKAAGLGAKWQADAKTWTVPKSATREALRIVDRHYSHRIAVRPEPITPFADACRDLCIQDWAPREVARAAYRALALLYHPDRGGDTRTMQRINAAWEAIGGDRE
jgi:hypothetical protein